MTRVIQSKIRRLLAYEIVVILKPTILRGWTECSHLSMLDSCSWLYIIHLCFAPTKHGIRIQRDVKLTIAKNSINIITKPD